MNTVRIKSRPVSKQPQLTKWIVLAISCISVASLGAIAVITGNRMVAIMSVGLPAVAGTAWLAINYGQSHRYG